MSGAKLRWSKFKYSARPGTFCHADGATSAKLSRSSEAPKNAVHLQCSRRPF